MGHPFKSYWRAYGGMAAVLRSPYLFGALIITVALAPAWVAGEWWTTVLQVLPNIVGFSIGGYAIWLGFGDDKFKALLAARDSDDETTPYMEVSATFCHFVIVQLLAIIAAVAGSAFNFDATGIGWYNSIAGWFGLSWRDVAAFLRPVGGFIGFFLFLYAIATALAAVMAIFQLAQWFDIYRANLERDERMQDHSPPADSKSSEIAGSPASRSSAVNAAPLH